MPADTDTALLGFRLQGTGNNDNSWGDILNASTIQLIENAIAAMVTVAVTGAGTTLSAVQRRAAVLQFTGTLTGNEVVTVSNLSKEWIVYNNTSGDFTLKFKTASGSASAAIRQGGWCRVWCDGADAIYVGVSTKELSAQFQGADGTEALPGISFSADLDTGLRRVGANAMALVANGADVVDITTAGIDVTGAVTENTRRIVPIGTTVEWDGIDEPAGWLFKYGQAISRSTYSLLFAVVTKTCTGDTNTSTSLTSISADLRNKGLIGAYIEGTGIPTGTTITAITATTITLSQAATASAAGLTFRILPYGQGDGSTTFNIPNDQDVVVAGRGDMSGTARGLLTDQTNGVNGTKLSDFGGLQTNTILQANLPSVNFAVTIPSGQGDHGHTVNNGSAVAHSGSGNSPQAGSGGMGPYSDITVNNATLPQMTGTAASGGSGTAVNNVQPTRISNKIIFTGVYS